VSSPVLRSGSQRPRTGAGSTRPSASRLSTFSRSGSSTSPSARSAARSRPTSSGATLR
jgi:hypothetical protein